MAGGTFVPASALRNPGRERPDAPQSVHSMLGLSERQAAVAEAVALGKPNKIIAYEMNLCESTVRGAYPVDHEEDAGPEPHRDRLQAARGQE